MHSSASLSLLCPTASALKPRARLTEDQVIQIFKFKDGLLSSSKLATIYRVSEKTVRDIWTGRTWSRETCHLDPSRTFEPKQTGRPKGCRDSRPRNKRGSGMRHRDSSSTGSSSAGLSKPDTESSSSGLAGRVVYQRQQASDTAIILPRSMFDQLSFPIIGLGLTDACTTCSSACHRSDPNFSYNAVDSNPSSMELRASLDDQLHDWDTFWSRPHSADPFRGDRRTQCPIEGV
jgi:hypothetical protein